MRGALAIFVKTPGLSPVKTRLAVGWGKTVAETFHLAAARAVAAVVLAASQAGDLQGYYAVAEADALHHRYWQDLPCIWQGNGGLGERMAHVYHTLLKGHDFVLLVGADIPQMTGRHLLSAADWLSSDGQARFALGPSADGGFWLLGGNCGIPKSVWTEVTYSRSDTGTQLHSRIQRIGAVKMLAQLRDIDEPEDLLALRDILLELTEPLREQQKLLSLLNKLPVIRQQSTRINDARH